MTSYELLGSVSVVGKRMKSQTVRRLRAVSAAERYITVWKLSRNAC
jgi:hypothetical protein